MAHSPGKSPAKPQLVSPKDRMQKMIDGTLGEGPPMAGVKTFPYRGFEKLYHEEFSAVVAGRITHPFLTTSNKAGSLPFNILSGSNYNEEAAAGPSHPRWQTEQTTQFYKKSPDRSSGAGVRTEQY